MTNHLHQSLLPALMCALLSVLSMRVVAQDVTFDLSTGATSSGDITLTYCASNITPKGASIYYASSDFYSLKIKSSNRSIAHVEFIGKATTSKNGNLEVAYGNGTLTGSSDAIMYWAGNSTSIQIWGMDSNTGYVITKLRIWYTGSAYTPSTEWNDTEEEAKVDLGGSPKDVHYYAHPKTLPAEGRGVPMAFVYPTKFRAALLDYMEWKTQQGYEVLELCVDDVVAETGKSDDDLALELRSRLMAMQPRPVYVLLCGDTPEVPAFKHRTQRPSIGIDPFSDFFYGEYTGDFFAEAYVGRFSASTVEDLQPQMEKTKYMAMIDPAEAGWLSHSLVVHSPASNITTEPAANFGKAFPLQWEGNTTDLILYASKTEQINQQIDGGCSQVAYVGHGDWDKWFDGWGRTNYTMEHAKQLKNKNKYPVVLGLTCLSGRYQSDCLAETFMRLKDAGAVAYFGASRESWDVSDNAFFTGGDGFNKTFQHIGYMRSLYHPLEEDESQLSRTIGEAFYIGKFSDRYLGELSPHRQFVELYNLFGDPTYQPYITVPKQMFATSSANAVAAGHAVSITTAPEAVVCISQGRHIVTAGVADKQGKLTLKLPVDAPVGECVLYASAPFYNDLKSSITVTEGDASEDHLAPATKLPHVQYADVVDVHTAASALTNAQDWPGSQPESFSVDSEAEYTMCASTNLNPGNFGYDYADWNNKDNDTLRAIYLRNRYDQCSFITTESAGQAAYVSVDWLHPCGQAEILGVYGKNSPYTHTSEAWGSDKGEKLGEICKGQNDFLLIEGDWAYIMVRAEDYATSAVDQNDVFLKSLTIGWNRIEGQTTGVLRNDNVDANDNYYDLFGRPYVRQPKSGILIQKGRKVIR